MDDWFSQSVNKFRNESLPEPGIPVGYAAIIERYALQVPAGRTFAAIAKRHHPLSTPSWRMFTPRYTPDPTLDAQLVFALRYEGIDLLVLAQLFRQTGPEPIADIVRQSPTGAYARRIWFLYEWLTGQQVELPDAGRVKAIPVVDPDLQYGLAEGDVSARHRVINNLPGTRAFCPMIRRTQILDAYRDRAFDTRAKESAGRIRPDLVARAAAFLLLSDSKSSFAIEGERPSGSRASRWGQAIAQAGARPLDLAELDRLQRIVIGDDRFVRLGSEPKAGSSVRVTAIRECRYPIISAPEPRICRRSSKG